MTICDEITLIEETVETQDVNKKIGGGRSEPQFSFEHMAGYS